MVVTKAGNLPCKFIFHLAPKQDQKSWKSALEYCFQEAEKLQLTSVALPPVGTGLQLCYVYSHQLRQLQFIRVNMLKYWLYAIIFLVFVHHVFI